MKGSILSDDRCALCGCKMEDNKRSAVCCPHHPDQFSKRLRVRLKYRGQSIHERFCEYDKASRFLTGIRFKIDEGTFDYRDYKRDNPLGFQNLVTQWLEVKAEKVRERSHQVIKNHISRATAVWENRNIKTIDYAEIEDLLFRHDLTKGLASKTRHDMRSALHDFWVWLRKRRILTPAEIPEFPAVEFTMAYRKVVDRNTQEMVLDEIRRLSLGYNERIYYAVLFLATYPSIRPGELIQVKEKDILADAGIILVRPEVAKDKKLRTIELIDEDVELLKSVPRSFGEMPFFRHESACGRAKVGDPFSEDYLAKWWKKACVNLGIEGVTLYPGTKHSTAISLGDQYSPEEIQGAMKIKTNAAFSRYFRVGAQKSKEIYAAARRKPEVAQIKKKGKV
jgi:integrase